MRRRGGVSLVGVMLLGALGAQPVAAGVPVTRHVGPGGGAGGCADPAYSAIQDAIDASGPGDTVLVCPGDYAEELAIVGAGRDGLTIRATATWKAVVRNKNVDQHLLVSDSDDVSIVGLHFRLPQGPCTDGVVMGIGITDGSQDTTIRANKLVNGRQDSLGACELSTGVFVEGGSSAWVGFNIVRDFSEYGIQVQGTATVIRNSVRIRHRGETSTDAVGYGIDVSGDGVAKVVRNAVTGLATGGNTTPRLDRGIQLSAGGGGSVFHDNYVRHAVWGAEMHLAAHFAFRRNTLLDSSDDGLRVAYVGGGVVKGNTSLRSGDLDCFAIEAGTAVYDNNVGETSDPAEMCSPPAP